MLLGVDKVEFGDLRLCYFFIAVVLTTACATTSEECDPREGGFFRGLYGISTGCYDNWLANKKLKRQKLLEEQERLRQEAQEMRLQLTQLDREMENTSRTIAGLKVSNETQRRILMEEERKLAADQAKLTNLDASLRQIQNTPEQVTPNGETIESVSKEINDIRERARKRKQRVEELTASGEIIRSGRAASPDSQRP